MKQLLQYVSDIETEDNVRIPEDLNRLSGRI